MSRREGRLGAELHEGGARFAVFSENAEAVELCLFDADDPGRETARVPLARGEDAVWRAEAAGLKAGALYGFRARGPYAPEKGHRFNPRKALLDPYARAIAGGARWGAELYAHRDGDLRLIDERDSAGATPRSVLADPAFDWEGDARPMTPWAETILYELHVKGFTARHPGVPERLRGTYSGLACPAAIEYLKDLGVTAVELLPVHHRISEHRLRKLGLSNYWGYGSIGFFAPDARFSSRGDRGGQVAEFKEMVRAHHRAGIEVILDVVYNHAGEGGSRGPHLSFRGLDNRAYYRVNPGDMRRYIDTTGCGNSLNVAHPATLRLIIDSLRCWAEEFRVDGFRFDLAPSLARGAGGFDPDAPFFREIAADPLLSRLKLIAEPWDLGEGGYQLGNFPKGWAEWNGKFRDAARRFWRADPGQAADFATRLAGSSDLFEAGGRSPQASVNFVACHDGFTLEDLVSFCEKRNEANLEGGRDGADANESSNGGVEGATDDPRVSGLRARRKRSLLASLFLAQGVPMLQAGDEFGRTQGGNNNAYCQDNEVSWVDWTLAEKNAALRAFVKRLVRLKSRPAFRRARFFPAGSADAAEAREIVWLHHAGRELGAREWEDRHMKCFGFRLREPGGGESAPQQETPNRDTFMVLMNAHHEAIPFVFLGKDRKRKWSVEMDTFGFDEADGRGRLRADGAYLLGGESLALLRREDAPPAAPEETGP